MDWGMIWDKVKGIGKYCYERYWEWISPMHPAGRVVVSVIVLVVLYKLVEIVIFKVLLWAILVAGLIIGIGGLKYWKNKTTE